MRGFKALGLLPLALSACTFMGAEKVKEIKDQIDADADVVPFAFDCDDFDPRRFPDYPEGSIESSDIPYDHVDNDCGDNGQDTLQFDLVDVDGDSFPGVDYATYAAEHRAMFGLDADAEVPWPANVSQDRVDCVDQDTPATQAAGIEASAIHPDVIEDIAYDGIDQDCQLDNDFDQDGDGQMPPTVDGVDTRPLVEAYILATGININLDAPGAFGDCDDGNDQRIISTPADPREDAPYDGLDADCDGSNDFDQDGDGYYPANFSAQFATFVQTYHSDTAPNGPLDWGPSPGVPAQPGDCLDASHPNPALAAVDAGTVYPGAPDSWYDGVDSDCGIDPSGNPQENNNDFDQDGDGYIPTDYLVDFDAYRANWSGSQPGYPSTLSPLLSGGPGDCNDLDPVAAPGNFELLFDDIDADCDENPNTTPFGFAGYAFDDPVRPRLARTDNYYVVATGARWGDVVAFQRENVAIFLPFGLDAEYDPTPLARPNWDNQSTNVNNIHGRGLDLVGAGDRFWLASSFYYEPTLGQYNRLLVREYQESTIGTLNGGFTASSVIDSSEWSGFDMDVDVEFVAGNTVDGTNGNTTASPAIWVVACGGAGREYPDLQGDGSAGTLRALGLEAPLQGSMSETVINTDIDMPARDGEVCIQRVAPDGTSSMVTTCDANGCSTFIADPIAGTITAGTNPAWATGTIVEADGREGLVVVVRETGGITIVDENNAAYNLLTDDTVVSADAMFREGVLYVAAVVETTGGAHTTLLGWTADPGTASAFESTEMPIYDLDTRFTHEPQGGCDPNEALCATGRNLDPYKVSLWVDHDADPSDDKLVVAVAAHSVDAALLPSDGFLPYAQDAIGWAFLGFASP